MFPDHCLYTFFISSVPSHHAAVHKMDQYEFCESGHRSSTVASHIYAEPGCNAMSLRKWLPLFEHSASSPLTHQEPLMQQHGITSPTTLLWKSHVVLSPWVHSEYQ